MSELPMFWLKPLAYNEYEAGLFHNYIDVEALFDTAWFKWIQAQFKRKHLKDYIALMQIEIEDMSPFTACYGEGDGYGIITLDRRLVRDQRKNADRVLRILIHEATHGLSWRYMPREEKKNLDPDSAYDPTELLASVSEAVFMAQVQGMDTESIRDTMLRDFGFSARGKLSQREERAIRRKIDQIIKSAGFDCRVK